MLILIIIISAIFGSFANNLISWFAGSSKLDIFRSKCFCGEKNLSIPELIPVVNFLLLKARCNHCNKKLSLRYPLIELITVLIGVICYLQYDSSFEFLLWFSVYYILLIIGTVDLIAFIIPNYLVLTLLVITLLKLLFINDEILMKTITSLSIFLFLLLINRISLKTKGSTAIGFGDIKLISVLILLFNFIPGILSIWISAVIAIPGFYLLKTITKRFQFEHRVPFGFFLALGFILTNTFELQITQFYYTLIGLN